METPGQGWWGSKCTAKGKEKQGGICRGPRRRIKGDGGEGNVLRREWRGSEDPHGWGQRGIEPPGRRGMYWKKRDVVGKMGSGFP